MDFLSKANMYSATTLEPGSRGVDTVLRIDTVDAKALFEDGYDFVVRYLAGLTKLELDSIMSTKLKLGLVTYANSFDPADEIAQLAALCIPKGVTVWLDVEDVKIQPTELIAKVNAWGKAIKQNGYIPGAYIGAGAQLTSKELYSLSVERYWHSCSRVLDRNNEESAPSCGWSMWQVSPPNQKRCGVIVDVDFVQKDYQGREVTFVSG